MQSLFRSELREWARRAVRLLRDLFKSGWPLIVIFAVLAAADFRFSYVHRLSGKAGDEINHLVTSLYYFHHGLELLNRVVYPPLYYLVSIAVLHVFGTSYQASAASNLPFLAALLIGTFGLTYRITQSRTGAAAAAALAGMYPLLAALSRMTMIDFALAGMTALSLWLLVETDAFRRREASILFGVSCGLGLLTREMFALFLAGPAIVEFVRAIRAPKAPPSEQNPPGRLVNLLIVVGIALLLASWWYVPDAAAKFRVRVDLNAGDANAAGFGFLSKTGLFYYPGAIAFMGISLPLALFLLAALPGFVARRLPHRLLLLSSMIPPYFVLSCVGSKTLRYAAPALPILAVITVSGFMVWPWKKARTAAIALLIAVGLFQWGTLAFGDFEGGWLAGNDRRVQALTGVRHYPASYEGVVFDPPRGDNADLERVGGYFKKEAASRGRLTIVNFYNSPSDSAPDTVTMNDFTEFPLVYYTARENLEAHYINCGFSGMDLSCRSDTGSEATTDFSNADFLMTPTGDAALFTQGRGDWQAVISFPCLGREKTLYLNRNRTNG